VSAGPSSSQKGYPTFLDTKVFVKRLDRIRDRSQKGVPEERREEGCAQEGRETLDRHGVRASTEHGETVVKTQYGKFTFTAAIR
jgi:hypothetical protein